MVLQQEEQSMPNSGQSNPMLIHLRFMIQIKDTYGQIQAQLLISGDQSIPRGLGFEPMQRLYTVLPTNISPLWCWADILQKPF